MNASEIKKLLLAKHSDAVCVPECKVGATWYTGCPRFDMWVMIKSWAHPRVIGYEIKVSRSDFLQDNKWPQYLQDCNEFYFVCADGIVDKRELSDECGLITTSTTGSRLFTRKKAPYRDVKINEDVFRYILMNRAVIGEERPREFDFWKAWLERRGECKEVGHHVSEYLSKKIRAEIENVSSENARLKENIAQYQAIKEEFDRRGISCPGWKSPETVVRELEERRGERIPLELKRAIINAESGIARAREIIDAEA